MNPEVAVYATLLRFCVATLNLAHGRRLHAHLTKRGRESLLSRDAYLSNLLLDLYGKSGSLDEAESVFIDTPRPDAISWNTLIAAYARIRGQEEKAVGLFELMLLQAKQPPDDFTFLPLLRASARLGDLALGKLIHGHIISLLPSSNIALKTALLHMYGCCGCAQEAQQLFLSLPERDLVAWNAMIAVYAQNGLLEEALHLLQTMGSKPNTSTFLGILAHCSTLTFSTQVHAFVVAYGFDLHISINNALVDMYSRCGSLQKACAVFSGMKNRDAISWNCMITAYTHNNYCVEALHLFKEMLSEKGITTSKVTFLCALNACSTLESGRAIHKLISANNAWDSDVALHNALLHMYSKCGSLHDASELFGIMLHRNTNTISWTTMITAYAQNGHCKDALQLFDSMLSRGIKPDTVTFLSVLEVCGSEKDLEKGREIHRLIVGRRYKLDANLITTLIDMYSRCGSLEDAWAVFNECIFNGLHLVPPWNAMIAAYAQTGNNQDALQLYHQMSVKGIKPDKVTFLCILNACTSLGSLENGRSIHECIQLSGVELDSPLFTALINMYGKCGSLKEAQALFDVVCEPDAILWNAMLAAYAQNGHGKEAWTLFHQQRNFEADQVTFLCLLKGCSHQGLLDEAWLCLVSMNTECFTMSSQEHYACIIDLLRRVGCPDVVEDMVRNMPLQSDFVTQTILLGAVGC